MRLLLIIFSLSFFSVLSAQTILFEQIFQNDSSLQIHADFRNFDNATLDTADIDGDGSLEVLLAGSGEAKIYKRDTLGNFYALNQSLMGVLGCARFGDLDGDSDMDLVIVGSASSYSSYGSSTVYLNDGSGNFLSAGSRGVLGVNEALFELFDKDLDGDLDMLLVGGASGTPVTHLYSNNGAGYFTLDTGSAFSSVTTKSGSYGNMKVGDIDSDGDIDVFLLGVNSGNYSIKLYLNDSLGNFTESSMNSFPVMIQGKCDLGDVDGDNDLDLIYGGTIRIYDSSQMGFSYRDTSILFINNGSGQFSPSINNSYGVGSGFSPRFADIDNDDDLDLLIRCGSALGGIADNIYFNNGTGQFNPDTVQSILGKGNSIFFDANGNGYNDLLCVGSVKTLYLNDTTGNFLRIDGSPLLNLNLADAAFADVDSDGDLDVFLSGNTHDPGAGGSALYLNNGLGDFSLTDSSAFLKLSSSKIAFEDIDNDGDEDLLMTGDLIGQGKTVLYKNNGQGQYSLYDDTSFVGVMEAAIGFSDIDNDGDSDLLITGLTVNDNYYLPSTPSPYSTNLYINNGNGNYFKVQNHPFGNIARGDLDFVDIDNDGDEDIFITGIEAGLNKAEFFKNDGFGNFTIFPNPNVEKCHFGDVKFADLDNDGDSDLILTGQKSSYASTKRLDIYLNDGNGNFTLASGNSTFHGISYSSFDLTDIDKDGDLDFMLSGTRSSSHGGDICALYVNNGFAVFQEYNNFSFPDENYYAVRFGDIDNDGDSDLLLTGRNTPITRLYRNVSCFSFQVDSIVACESFTWGNGVTYTQSCDTVRSIYNLGGLCDSIVELHLEILRPDSSLLEVSSCENYTWLNTGLTYFNSGVYYDTLTNVYGCDSIVTLNLMINQPSNSTDSIVACNAYTWIDGNIYTSSNYIAVDTLQSSMGCDSIVTLNLTIHQGDTLKQTASQCDSYIWPVNGSVYNTSGTYIEVFSNSNGCDSVRILDLTITNSDSVLTEITACHQFTWIDGNTYSSDTLVSYTTVNAHGCDSILYLDLTIDNLDTTIILAGITLTSNLVGVSYQWYNCDTDSLVIGATSQSFTPTIDGNYAVIVSDSLCSDTSSCISIKGIGFTENNTISEVLLYPNPSTGAYNLEFKNVQGQVDISIFDAVGSLVSAQSVQQNSTHTTGVIEGPKGLYFITVQGDNLRKQIFKLIKN